MPRSNIPTSDNAWDEIKRNPFYILNVSCADNRRAIVSAAEDMSFVVDPEWCSAAQNTLLTPAKRLNAEMNWFVDVSKETLTTIRNAVDTGNSVSVDVLSGLSRLNATIYNLTVGTEEDIFDLGYAIVDIDELYGLLDATEITEVVNICRRKAQMSEVNTTEVEVELSKKRESIRRVIGEKIRNVDQNAYVELVTMLAQKCIADELYKDGIILADVVDQYEMRMQPAIEERTSKIESQISALQALVDSDSYASEVEKLTMLVAHWKEIVYPIQVKANASGMPYEISDQIGKHLRELALFFHNERERSDISLQIVTSMRPLFAASQQLTELFSDDEQAIRGIIKDNTETQQIVAEIKSINSYADTIKRCMSYELENKINELIRRVMALSNKLKNSSLDKDTVLEARKNLCYMARSIAIELHNEKQQTTHAYNLTKALLDVFGDVAELRTKLEQDKSALANQLVAKAQRDQHERAAESAVKAKGIGCLVFIGFILLVWIISSLSQCSSSGTSGTSNSGNSNRPTSSYSDSYKPATETKFSQSSKNGDKVYIDIKSIEPSIGIYTTYGSSSGEVLTDLACKCKTSSGTTVYIYMTCSEYTKYFDADTSSFDIQMGDFDTVTFSTAKRVHGTARKSDNMCDGLADDTGTMILEFSSLG